MTSTAQQQTHRKWLLELTAIPTAAGREHRVVQYITDWVNRRRDLKLGFDKSGNMLITRARKGKTRSKPLFITAHLDHPAFVVTDVLDEHKVELEFRGGVHDPYFHEALIDIIDDDDQPHLAAITHLNTQAKPFKRVVAQLRHPTDDIVPGDIGRWYFGDNAKREAYIEDDHLHAPACDDLAAVAAALAVMDLARKRKGMEHVGLLLTVAEEVGFIGAIAACKHRSVPKTSRLLCLENSRSFAESPIGSGPILRVGDRISVFAPSLTNQISTLMTDRAQKLNISWQRKLMPGGACEATAFSAYGYESTCICLPLGNYHNMVDIDDVQAGQRPARVAPETIAVNDYHDMIDMLLLCAAELDTHTTIDLKKRMEKLHKDRSHVLNS